MSSNRASQPYLEAWVVVLVSLGLTGVYLRFQLLHSLAIVVQLLRMVFPGLNLGE